MSLLGTFSLEMHDAYVYVCMNECEREWNNPQRKSMSLFTRMISLENHLNSVDLHSFQTNLIGTTTENSFVFCFDSWICLPSQHLNNKWPTSMIDFDRKATNRVKTNQTVSPFEFSYSCFFKRIKVPLSNKLNWVSQQILVTVMSWNPSNSLNVFGNNFSSSFPKNFT